MHFRGNTFENFISTQNGNMYVTFSDTHFLLFFWPHYTASGILFPYPGMGCMPLQWKGGVGVLTTGPPGNFPCNIFLNSIYY